MPDPALLDRLRACRCGPPVDAAGIFVPKAHHRGLRPIPEHQQFKRNERSSSRCCSCAVCADCGVAYPWCVMTVDDRSGRKADVLKLVHRKASSDAIIDWVKQ